MNCPKCNAEVNIRSQFCPQCGGKVVVEFNAIADQVHDDYASDRGQKITNGLQWAALGLFILFFAGWCVSYAFDKKLIYDFAEIPALPAEGSVVTMGPESIYNGPTEPRPNPPLGYAPLRVLGHREEKIRQRFLIENKGGNDVENAIEKGLRYLNGIPSADGGFPVVIYPAALDQGQVKDFQWGRTGVTGLALLAYFGAGHSWVPAAGERPSVYANVTQRATRWLLQQQDESGRFGPGEGEGVHFMYSQGMATLAMVEAAGLTGDETLRASAQKGVDFIVKAQTAQGGWNYFGHPVGEDDTSVSAWQVQALVAAKEIGLDVPAATLRKSLDLYQNATKNGRVIYRMQNDDNRDVVSLAGVALMVRHLLGDDPTNPQMLQLTAKMLTSMPNTKREWGKNWAPRLRKDDDARALYDPYAVYFAQYGMFFSGGKAWETWNEKVKKSILEMQDNDGCWRTSDINTGKGGVAYSTALSVLSLEVYFRVIHSWAP